MTQGVSQTGNLPRRFIKTLIDILFPPVCPLCRKNVDAQEICSACLDSFKRIEGPKCTVCGTPFLTEGDSDHPCGRCMSEKRWFDSAASMYLYEDGVAEAVRSLKYSKRTSLAAPLGDLLASHPACSGEHDLIMAVPLHKTRLRQRGFNQSQLLARQVAGLQDIANDPYALKRTRATPSQAGMNRRERAKNVRGAFSLSKNADVAGRRILLIDDVYTTGATVGECSRVLKKAAAKSVDVLTLARSVSG